MKKGKKLGKTIQNMKNQNSVKINPSKSKKPFSNKKRVMIEANYQRSLGYDTKTRKVKDGYILFRSKTKRK